MLMGLSEVADLIRPLDSFNERSLGAGRGFRRGRVTRA